MRELVLDASFALRWLFEDQATAQTESLLTALQDQQTLQSYQALKLIGRYQPRP